MTERLELHYLKRKKAQISPGRLCLGWLGIFCLFLMLKNSSIAMEYITRGLRLCAKTVIPSLFPFMVISDLILSSGLGETLLRPIAPVCCRLLRLPQVGCYAVIMGLLCGFPIGARCAISALKANQMTEEEVLRVLLFSTNPSAAFLINAVGASLWGNQRFGMALFASVLLSQILSGLLLTYVFCKKEHDLSSQANTTSSEKAPTISLTRQFTQAIGSASTGILLICAYVVFFSALSGTVNLVLEGVGAPSSLKVMIACILELSGGASAACGLAQPLFAALLCAFAAGWGGISVHCQLMSVCDGFRLKFSTYLLAKLLQSILCALLLWGMLSADPTLLIRGIPY